MASPRPSKATPPVERDLAVRMFEVMALMRAVEDRMVTMYRQGELLGSLYTGHWHKAIAVGTASTSASRSTSPSRAWWCR
jgi:TPP-dependent pyruvate/acetoin dehydrogenase alpha subunit